MSVATESPTTAEAKPADGADLPSPVAGAKAPRSAGTISLVGILLSLLVIAAGVVGVQSALVAWSLLKGKAWLDQLLSSLGAVQPQPWMVGAGVALALLGLWLVLVAVRPRPRTSVELTAETGVFLAPREVARSARHAAEGVDGVTSVKTSASRRVVRVAVRSTSDDGIADRVTSAVTKRLSALRRAPRVKVDVTVEGNS